MDLWIRSQDKKYLIKCDGLYINKSDNGIKKSYKIMIDFIDLGIYETEKRALEVLDEIQKFITIQETIEGDYETQDLKIKSLLVANLKKVYAMPKE